MHFYFSYINVMDYLWKSYIVISAKKEIDFFMEIIINKKVYIQDVTHRSKSIIGNLIDKSILLDFNR